MKTIITKSVTAIILLTMHCLYGFSQGKPIEKEEIPAPVTINESVLKDRQNQDFPSADVIDFQNRFKAARESGNREEMLRLQRESDRVLGTYTSAPTPLGVKILDSVEPDNIITHSITNSNSKSIHAMATCTEHSGNNIGRIWSVNTYYETPPDIVNGFQIHYSDNNGETWTHFRTYGFPDYIGNDFQLDAELIINSSNEKYLWIVYKTDINYTNTIKAGLFIVKLNSNNIFDFSHTYLNWPGGSNVYYKTPRLVSDNAQYSDLALMYIVASFDSSNTSNPITNPGVFGEKVAVCYDPYTTSPLISYRPRPFTRTLTGYTHNPDLEHFNCDIAYYRNDGQDSLLIIETGLESSSSLVLTGTSVVSFLSSNPYVVYKGAINTNSNKRTRGFIASNGGFNNLMISVKYEYSSADHDIEYYRSTNGSGNWLRGFIDNYTSDAVGDADITAQRNAPGKFAVAFNTNFPSRLNYYQSDSYIWSSVSINNFSHLKSQWSNPKAGIRLNSGSENCFAIWADTTHHGLWSSAGCSGPVVTYAKLLLSAAIEGLYIPETEAIVPDTVRVYLRNATAPYDIIDSSANVLRTLASNEFIFSNAQYNIPLYIQIKHRNALESWSSGTITFTAYEKSYSFLIHSNTYGSNSKQINFNYPIFGFYSGDVNQDGIIDAADMQLVDNDAFESIGGYVASDVNGDYFVDASDLFIIDNNAYNSIIAVTP